MFDRGIQVRLWVFFTFLAQNENKRIIIINISFFIFYLDKSSVQNKGTYKRV